MQRELAEVERLLKQERGERAENTKSTGLREENLQQELSESASALVRMQRQLEERNLRVGGESAVSLRKVLSRTFF